MLFESLESRVLLSGVTPAQLRHAYGFDRISFPFQGTTYLGSGRNQTIAIVEAYGDPTIASDLRIFDAANALPINDAQQKFTVTVATPQGPVAENDAWAKETALDVEWAHGIAPKAHILLVEAKSASFPDLMAAVDYARHQQGVSAVSMSWTVPEYSGETSYGSTFLTPPGHRPVSFFAAIGDTASQTSYPAASVNVISVGGTNLSTDANGDYLGETVWSSSGYGTSIYTGKSTPDVAYDAAPIGGFSIYVGTPSASPPGWTVDAGTSGGAPQWAALAVIADQGRAYRGLGSLDGSTQLLPALRSMSDDFHAVAGHTGLGTPMANELIPALISSVPAYSVASVVSSRVFASGPPISALDAVRSPSTKMLA